MKTDTKMNGGGGDFDILRLCAVLGVCLMLCVPLVSIMTEEVYAPYSTITIKFNCDGGVWSSPDTITTSGIMDPSGTELDVTIPEEIPVKDGFTFSHWEVITPGISPNVLNPGDRLLSYTAEKEVEIKAIWVVSDNPILEFLSDPLTDGTISYGNSAELIVYENANESFSQEGT